MNNDSRTAPKDESAKLAYLKRHVECQILRQEGIIKESMESLTADFNENFERKSEVIYKGNLKLEFLNDVRNLLNEEDCNIHAARFFLRHAAEHAADDIMHRDPYNNSSNGATDLAHRWQFEGFKNIYHLALNLLDRLNPDEEC